jgi:hypothetical protein
MEDNFEGVNESVPAEQTEVSETEVNTEGTEGEVETTETPEATEEQPELDRNAIYADARRRAEAEAKRKQAAVDAEYAERFKDYKNPITGQPIKSAKDYFDALTAQEQLQTKKTLADNGIDPNLIEKAVNNSPAVKAANLVIAEQRIEKVKSYIEEQVREVGKLDPDIRSAQDIEKSDRYPEILNYVNNNRLSIVDAYKLVYADKLNEKKTAAVKQQTINNARSQSHLKATESGAGSGDNLVNIPENQLAKWREFFPDKSDKELREIYNNSLH